MRTKHLLYTMALAGTFAACMQEEFVTVDSADALAGRKSIGKITFTEAPSTRWAVEDWDEIKPEDDDAFSLMLVDVPREGLNGQHVYPIDNYELINKLQTNFIFKKGANGWGSDAELVEGNYLYVAPAQEGKLDRNTVEITLPTEQNLSLGADGKLDPLSALKEFVEKKYPFYIGHRFLSEDGSISLPKMASIFAYPEITVTNTDMDGRHTPVLTKVIIKQENPGDAFVINAPLKADEAAKLLTNEYFEDRENTDTSKDKVVVGDWAGHMSQYFGVEEIQELKQVWKNDSENNEEIPATAIFEAHDLNGQVLEKYMYNKGLNGATSDLLGDPKSKSQYIVINMPEGGIALDYQETIKFNAVIPAETYSMTVSGQDKGLTIYAVLENGQAYRKVVRSDAEGVENKKRIEMYPGKRYPNQDYSGLEVKGEAGLYFTVDLHDGATDGMNKYEEVDAASIIGGVGTIDSTEDLIAAIKHYSSSEKLNLTVEGRNVVYNEEVNKAVANTDCQSVNIQGNIKVEGEEDAAKNAWTINPKVTIEDAVIEKGKVAANENSLKKVFVAKNAELTLNNVTSTNAAATIYNTGVLTLNTADFKYVENYGKLKVGTDLSKATNIKVFYAACGEGNEIISPSIDLIPSVNVLADGKFAISGDLNYEITVDAKTATKDAGELVLSGRTRIVKNYMDLGGRKIERNGNIINNGLISDGLEKEEDSQVLVVNAGQEMTVGKEGEVKSQVMVRGASHTLQDLQDKGGVAAAEYTPAAVVYNNGTLNSVKVDGKLVMGQGSRVKGNVTAAEDGNTDGEIDNTAKGVLAGRVPQKVTVYATFNGLDLTDAEARQAARNEFNKYTESYKVKVARLVGAVVIADNDAYFMKKDLKSTTINELEFAKGSSLSIGDAMFSTDLKISVSAKDVEWTGNTKETSKINMNKVQGEKKLYLVTENGEKSAEKGNVKFINCEEKSSLK